VLLDGQRVHNNICDPVQGYGHLPDNLPIPSRLQGLIDARYMSLEETFNRLLAYVRVR
jgi:hypothetical protein